MIKYETIDIEKEKVVATIWLNRPDIRNAFNGIMIEELTNAFEELGTDSSVRLIILRGRGKAFCAGADLNWMRQAKDDSREVNYRESLKLSECFFKIYTCEKPVITCVHGASTGGANGLVAASDIALCADDTVFSLSEVKIGLVPSVVSPYIIKRIGEFPARELMLTARRFYGIEAAGRGLVNRSFPAEEVEQELAMLVEQLIEGGPEALGIIKRLIFDVCNNLTICNSVGKTAGIIADIRTSEEAQEGMSAYLEKRKPKWITEQ
ncbi:MAG: enoyl-CoA hydratase-related protein [Bacteroidales bacterium]